jgi:hypothetical protein
MALHMRACEQWTSWTPFQFGTVLPFEAQRRVVVSADGMNRADEGRGDEQSSGDGKGNLRSSHDAERMATKNLVISRVAKVAREIGNSRTVERISTKGQ